MCLVYPSLVGVKTLSDTSYPTVIESNFMDEYGVMTCPECGGYMQRYKVGFITSSLLGVKGKWHCLSCDYVDNSSPTTNTEET